MPDTFVHVDDMVMQLKFIKRKYRIITPDDLLASLNKGTSLPQNAALVTFDDGYESFFRLAEPILRSMGIKTVVFIPTRYVEQQEPFWFDLVWFFVKYADGNKSKWLTSALSLEYINKDQSTLSALCLNKMKRMTPEYRDEIIGEIKEQISYDSGRYSTIFRLFHPMTAKQLRILSNQETTFGGHTHTHTILSALSKEEAEKEIITNKKMLESLTGKQCLFFAYPNGGAGDFSDIHKNILKSSGYKVGFSLTQYRSYVAQDPFDISRFHISPYDSLRSIAFHASIYSKDIKKMVGKLR